MMRRNKQKIFNKHSMMFKSPLSDRHMMRDMNTHPSVTSKLYDESEPDESTSIYHEPYRLVLQRNSHRNNSCGRLCDREYEDLHQANTGLLMEQKTKFGSTPLFNIPPAPPVNSSSATARPKIGPPTSFSCHEVKNGYAVPNTVSENFYAATDIVLKVNNLLF